MVCFEYQKYGNFFIIWFYIVLQYWDHYACSITLKIEDDHTQPWNFWDQNLHLKKWKDLILILTYIPVNSNTCLNDIIWHNLKITNFYNVLYFFFFLCVVPFKYRYFILIYMYLCILHISAMSASEYISVYRMNNQGRLFLQTVTIVMRFRSETLLLAKIQISLKT